MRRTAWVTTALLLVLVGTGRGLPAQSAPAPASQHLLQQLVGHWRMVGQVRGKPATYDLLAKRILNNRFVELHMKDVASPAQYEALVLVGEDTAAGHVIRLEASDGRGGRKLFAEYTVRPAEARH